MKKRDDDERVPPRENFDSSRGPVERPTVVEAESTEKQR
jgi:hypothetical protein